MKNIHIFLALLFLLPFSVEASSVFRSETAVFVSPDQVVSGDFYSLGKNSVSIQGVIEGDLISSSADVEVEGLVEEDVLVVASKVKIRGEVKNNVRVIADTVVISGKIDGNVSVIARDLQILSSAEIFGDVLMFGASPFLLETSASIEGFIGGNIYGHADTIRLNGKIDGVVEIRTNDLTLGDAANIPQYIKYESVSDLRRSPNSVVGNVIRNDPTLFSGDNEKDTDLIKSGLKVLLVNLFAALVLFLLFRRQMERVAYQAVNFSLRNFTIGFIVLFLTPAASTVLFLSILGILLSFSVLLVYFLVITLSVILAGPVFGYFLSSFWNKDKKREVSIVSITVGVTALNFTLFALPIVFGLVFFLTLFSLTLGTVVFNLYKVLRS